jgi:hypothetical protein
MVHGHGHIGRIVEQASNPGATTRSKGPVISSNADHRPFWRSRGRYLRFGCLVPLRLTLIHVLTSQCGAGAGGLPGEVALVTTGVEADVLGFARNEIPVEALAEIVALHPRPGFKQRILKRTVVSGPLSLRP